VDRAIEAAMPQPVGAWQAPDRVIFPSGIASPANASRSRSSAPAIRLR
jgi:hypothetical protein